MNGAIADLHWNACESCKNGRPEGGCDLGDSQTFTADNIQEQVICDDYVEEVAP